MWTSTGPGPENESAFFVLNRISIFLEAKKKGVRWVAGEGFFRWCLNSFLTPCSSDGCLWVCGSKTPLPTPRRHLPFWTGLPLRRSPHGCPVYIFLVSDSAGEHAQKMSKGLQRPKQKSMSRTKITKTKKQTQGPKKPPEGARKGQDDPKRSSAGPTHDNCQTPKGLYKIWFRRARENAPGCSGTVVLGVMDGRSRRGI